MDAILDIPGPEPGDSESVVASLEAAAVFGARGDAAEALRWLQRAAESAGDSGDDHRTLALAQTLATLKGRVESSPPSSAGSSAEGDDDAEEDAAPFLLESRAVMSSVRPPPPSSRAPGVGTPRPPPSAHQVEASNGTSVKGAPTLKSTPVAKNQPPAAASKAEPPMPNGAVLSPPSQPPASPRSLTPTRPVPSAAPSNAPARAGAGNGRHPTPSAPPARVAPKSVTPSLLGAPPAAAAAAARAGTPEVLRAPGQPRARQAARVAVTKSLTERGLFFVRVLDEGQEPPSDAFEGMLVSGDPNITLL